MPLLDLESIMENRDIDKIMDVNKQRIINLKEDVKHVMDFAKCYIEEEMQLDIFEVKNGSFGGLFLASSKIASTEKLNIKVVVEEKCTAQDKNIWPKLRHSNVVYLLDKEYIPWIHSYIFISEQHPFTLEEFQTSPAFRENKDAYNLTRKLLMDVLNGIAYLHDKNISHLNITSKNVWITDEKTAVIGNFNTLNTIESIPDEDEVPFNYGPPELEVRKWRNLVRGGPYDVWCFGLLSVEIFTRDYLKQTPGFPLWNLNVYPTMWKILQKRLFKKLCKKTFKHCEINEGDIMTMFNLLHTCLKISPSERPSAKELLKHQFFSQKDGYLSVEDSAWIKKVNAPMSTWMFLVSSTSSTKTFLQLPEQTSEKKNTVDIENHEDHNVYENLAFCIEDDENNPHSKPEKDTNKNILPDIEYRDIHPEELKKAQKGETTKKYSMRRIFEWFRNKTMKAHKFFSFHRKK